VARAKRDLTRDQVLAAALRLAERDGVTSLTMRKVAKEVGVEAMSLYNHVTDKEAMLDGLADVVLGKFEFPEPTGDWVADVRAIAHAFRRFAVQYPQTAPLILTRQSFSPALLRVADTILGVLIKAGFAPAQAVHAMRALLANVVGVLLREMGASPSLAGDDAVSRDRRVERLVASELPNLGLVATDLSIIDHEAEFDFTLDLVLGSLQRILG
jgi:TetR/AcrR family transcriptional regulator, tetracycline repressor protein